MVDTRDSKSLDCNGHVGSSPTSGTRIKALHLKGFYVINIWMNQTDCLLNGGCSRLKKKLDPEHLAGMLKRWFLQKLKPNARTTLLA